MIDLGNPISVWPTLGSSLLDSLWPAAAQGPSLKINNNIGMQGSLRLSLSNSLLATVKGAVFRQHAARRIAQPLQ